MRYSLFEVGLVGALVQVLLSLFSMNRGWPMEKELNQTFLDCNFLRTSRLVVYFTPCPKSGIKA